MMKSLNTQFSVKCIYCGNTGVTKEHVISDWIGKEFFKGATKHHFGRFTKNPDNKDYLFFQPLKSKQGHLGTLKVKKVCAECNNGWMSIIVNNSRNIISSLISRNETILTPDNQEKIAAWIALMLINFEHAERRDSRVSEEELPFVVSKTDREYLKDNLMPSSNWEIFLAHSDKKIFKSYISAPSMVIRPTGTSSTIPNVLEFLVAIEGFLFIARYKNNPDLPFLKRYEQVGKLSPIWPNREESYTYDLNLILNEDESDNIALLFSERNFEKIEFMDLFDTHSIIINKTLIPPDNL